MGRKIIVLGMEEYFIRSTRRATSRPTATAAAGTISSHSTVRRIVCWVVGSVKAYV